MSDALLARLRTHKFLSGLPDGTTDLVAEHADLARFRPGTLIFREGDPAERLYLVTHGHVSVEIHAPGRGALMVEKVPPGRVVGLSWVAPPYRYEFDARAIDEVEAVTIAASPLREALAADPAVGFPFLEKLTGLILERLQATRIRLLDLYGRVESA